MTYEGTAAGGGSLAEDGDTAQADRRPPVRRTRASELVDAGATITDVQGFLRHQSLGSTQHYLRRSNTERLRSMLDA